MAFELSLKINNEIVSDYLSDVRVTSDHPTLNWEFDVVDKVSVDPEYGVITDIDDYTQIAYEIRISTTDFNIGTEDFIADTVQTGLIYQKSLFWNYAGPQVERGTVYYGQIYAIDELGRDSDIKTFSFALNQLPNVDNALVTP